VLKKYSLINFCNNFNSLKFILETKDKQLVLMTIDIILLKYIFNGLFATIVHYCVFIFSINFFNFQYTATADFIAAFFGISISFLGNKYLVFNMKAKRPFAQYLFFFFFYIFLVLIHSAIIFLMTDILFIHYNMSFLLATFFQFLISFAVNKNLTFKYF